MIIYSVYAQVLMPSGKKCANCGEPVLEPDEEGWEWDQVPPSIMTCFIIYYVTILYNYTISIFHYTILLVLFKCMCVCGCVIYTEMCWVVSVTLKRQKMKKPQAIKLKTGGIKPTGQPATWETSTLLGPTRLGER